MDQHTRRLCRLLDPVLRASSALTLRQVELAGAIRAGAPDVMGARLAYQGARESLEAAVDAAASEQQMLPAMHRYLAGAHLSRARGLLDQDCEDLEAVWRVVSGALEGAA